MCKKRYAVKIHVLTAVSLELGPEVNEHSSSLLKCLRIQKCCVKSERTRKYLCTS